MEPLTVDLDFVSEKRVYRNTSDCVRGDLLSCGLGAKGLQGPVPVFKNPVQPTTDEIRRRTIYHNYRALVDMSGSYYGRLYGPGIKSPTGERIPGEEYTAFSVDTVTMVLQIPDHFNPERPWLIAAPSSGSRGVFGAVGVVGEWALKKGFAVVYTDKGTGIGFHDLSSGIAIRIDGQTSESDSGRLPETFRARLKSSDTYSVDYPGRLAVKQAHDQDNCQRKWGDYLLQAVRFGLYMIDRRFGVGEKTRVIAAGISNGGGASLMAAEKDDNSVIDAVVVAEPNVTPLFRNDFGIAFGSRPVVRNHSKSLVDYTTLLNIYQPCLSLSDRLKDAPFNFYGGNLSRKQCEERVLSLKEKGLVRGETFSDVADYVEKIFLEAGFIREQEILLPSHYNLDIIRSIALMYILQYGRFDTIENCCGFTYGAVNDEGVPDRLKPEQVAAFFSDHSGIPPSGTIGIINELNPGGAREDRKSVSPSTGRADMNLDGALRLRRLVTGKTETGQPLSPEEQRLYERVNKGIDEIRVSGKTGRRPVVIVTGRSDAVLQINHTSRAYAGLKLFSGTDIDRFRYYEITNAHHIDALNKVYADPELCSAPVRFAPLLHYYNRALDSVIRWFEAGEALPVSQVVRPDSPEENLPEIASAPPKKDRITFKDNLLYIPE